jgi:hypothetical protein
MKGIFSLSFAELHKLQPISGIPGIFCCGIITLFA